MTEYEVILVRSLASFIIIFILARILGKSQISQLTFFDYVIGITIGNMAAAVGIDSSVEFLNGIIGLLVYTSLSILLAFGAIKSYRFRKIVEGSPTILIKEGRVLEKNLLKSKLTYNDLMAGLREKNAFKLSEIELAVLETDGQMSVMKKAEYEPLTPKDLNMIVEEEHKPSMIIIDGSLMEKRLHYLGYSKEWVLGEIMKKGANSIDDVFLAQIDSQGNVYVDLYDDNIKTQQIKQKPLLAAQLRKIQANLEGFALQTDDVAAKQMYYNQSKELQNLIHQINPYLKE
ncbi:DUF421 domain-containing protein [Schinkia azotoformans]|uniref:DUF421 domain-containing protein n=1 Tax=Schinkia azotoformans TaxID=1454 RepID=UPI002DB9E369|nr:DUF421 domain-containing protein [Schinkia azotoformans]MEC1721432.1 DUF421 domain-containing protein [Schinkia azotoformans]MED4414690.1 DUF421 domain-containing protein [Schinkia azotoformans]